MEFALQKLIQATEIGSFAVHTWVDVIRDVSLRTLADAMNTAMSESIANQGEDDTFVLRFRLAAFINPDDVNPVRVVGEVRVSMFMNKAQLFAMMKGEV